MKSLFSGIIYLILLFSNNLSQNTMLIQDEALKTIPEIHPDSKLDR